MTIDASLVNHRLGIQNWLLAEVRILRRKLDALDQPGPRTFERIPVDLVGSQDLLSNVLHESPVKCSDTSLPRALNLDSLVCCRARLERALDQSLNVAAPEFMKWTL